MAETGGRGSTLDPGWRKIDGLLVYLKAIQERLPAVAPASD
ncbi:MAG: hypothetical protein V3T72_02225 [Thermoanaerobaculia bacterium]